MTITKRPAMLAAFGVAGALILGACGGGGGDKGDDKAADTTASTAPASATEPAAATLNVEAHEFSLAPADLKAAPGNVAIRYTNAGAIQHTLLIEGVGGFKLDVASAGAEDTGTAKLEPGTYTLYCDVPGHRAAGMHAQLTVG